MFSFWFAALLPGATNPATLREKIQFQHESYGYRVVVPAQGLSGSFPVLLLLHGAGGRPEDMLVSWEKQAARDDILLIAPELPRIESFESIAPALFRRIVEDVSRKWKVDPDRVYVFGHSMGGYLALDATMLDADLFAGAAVHASFISPGYAGIVQQAARKTPIALYIGEKDQLVALAQVRATRDLLLSRGFPLHYVEIPGHDHDYLRISDRINEDAWKFLSGHRLK